MRYALVHLGLITALAVLLHWRELKRANALTRWFFVCVLGLAACIHVYVTVAVYVIRPAYVLHWLLEPFDPIE